MWVECLKISPADFFGVPSMTGIAAPWLPWAILLRGSTLMWLLMSVLSLALWQHRLEVMAEAPSKHWWEGLSLPCYWSVFPLQTQTIAFGDQNSAFTLLLDIIVPGSKSVVSKRYLISDSVSGKEMDLQIYQVVWVKDMQGGVKNHFIHSSFID